MAEDRQEPNDPAPQPLPPPGDPLPLTGAVLAGGLSRRMGRPKAFIEFGGRSLLDWVLNPVSACCQDVMLVTRLPIELMRFNVRIVRDLTEGQGPLRGLATALFFSRHPWVLLTACDLPLIQVPVLKKLVEMALNSTGNLTAFVPRSTKGWEPLMAVYSRDCLGPARDMIRQGRQKLGELTDRGVRWIPIDLEEFRPLDPDLISFTNVNTPQDLARLKALPGVAK